MKKAKKLKQNEKYQKFYIELDTLKRSKCKEIAERIKQAQEYGDISDNSEYDEAKNEQAFVEGRIKELEYLIYMAESSQKENCKQNIGLGCIVHLETEGGIEIYEIVTVAESDPGIGKISADSPIGKAMIGKTIGDDITVKTPKKELNYKIIKII
jgi:transcription elongation factor GreA